MYSPDAGMSIPGPLQLDAVALAADLHVPPIAPFQDWKVLPGHVFVTHDAAGRDHHPEHAHVAWMVLQNLESLLDGIFEFAAVVVLVGLIQAFLEGPGAGRRWLRRW